MAMLGFLTNRVHDLKLGIPAGHAPSRGDFLTLGGQTLLPLLIFGLGAVVVYVVVRTLARVGGWMVRRSPALGHTLDATTRTVRESWFQAWGRMRPAAVADLYFVTVVVLGGLALFPFRGLLEAMALSDTRALSDPFLRRSFSMVLSIVIVTLLFSWRGIFRWLGRRTALTGRIALARWGSLTWILLLLVVATLPWRLLWDADAERVLVDGRRGYLLKETDTSLLVYEPDAGTTVVHAKNSGVELRRLGGSGYPFEGPDAFPVEGGRD